MNNEANWHNITATLLREIERLRSEVAISAENCARTKSELELMATSLEASPTPAFPARECLWIESDLLLENDEEEEGTGGEEYEESETESEQYWTDREYITDDAWETGSDDETLSDDGTLSNEGSETSSVQESGTYSEEESEIKDATVDGAEKATDRSYYFATPTPVERRKRKVGPTDESRPVAMYVFGDIAGLPLRDQVGIRAVQGTRE